MKVDFLERNANASRERLDTAAGNACGNEKRLPKSAVINEQRMLGGIRRDMVAEAAGYSKPVEAEYKPDHFVGQGKAKDGKA